MRTYFWVTIWYKFHDSYLLTCPKWRSQRYLLPVLFHRQITQKRDPKNRNFSAQIWQILLRGWGQIGMLCSGIGNAPYLVYRHIFILPTPMRRCYFLENVFLYNERAICDNLICWYCLGGQNAVFQNMHNVLFLLLKHRNV